MLAERVSRSGIPFVFLDFPLHDRHLSTVAGYDDVLRKNSEIFLGLKQEFSVGYIQRTELGSFSPSEFRDHSHMNEAGRERLTRFAAARVIEELLKRGIKPISPPAELFADRSKDA